MVRSAREKNSGSKEGKEEGEMIKGGRLRVFFLRVIENRFQ